MLQSQKVIKIDCGLNVIDVPRRCSRGWAHSSIKSSRKKRRRRRRSLRLARDLRTVEYFPIFGRFGTTCQSLDNFLASYVRKRDTRRAFSHTPPGNYLRLDPEPECRKWRRGESERPFIVHSIFFIMHIALHQSLIVLMWLLTGHRTLHWAHALHPYQYAHSDTLVYCNARRAVTNRLTNWVSVAIARLLRLRAERKNCICKALKINLNKLSDRKKNFNFFFVCISCATQRWIDCDLVCRPGNTYYKSARVCKILLFSITKSSNLKINKKDLDWCDFSASISGREVVCVLVLNEIFRTSCVTCIEKLKCELQISRICESNNSVFRSAQRKTTDTSDLH